MVKKLADGDYFVMIDYRSACKPKGGYDPNPKLSLEIKKQRKEFYHAFNPKWNPDLNWGDLFHCTPTPDFRMPPELVLNRISFRSDAPENGLEHYMCIAFRDFASTGSDAYHVVSPEWRAAVEGLEKVHEFFPYMVEFRDREVSRWIFRAHQNVIDEYIFGIGSLADGIKVKAYFPIEAARGKHLFMAGRAPRAIVSRELAGRLLAMLPRQVNFYPLEFDA
jgi:hypothetical protein